MKKRWCVEVSQNQWEYTGYVFIKAINVKKISKDTVSADGLEIMFDEVINEPYIYLENKPI